MPPFRTYPTDEDLRIYSDELGYITMGYTPYHSPYETVPLDITGVPLNIPITEEDYALIDDDAEVVDNCVTRSGVQKEKPQRKRRSPTQVQTRTPNRVQKHSNPPKPSIDGRVSKLGELKAKLGDKRGSDYREVAELRWDNGTKLGLVDKEWKPAAHHVDFREKFILMDAQQPGAPVWRSGMSLDYTSYSPIMQGWTEDPASIRDLKGRQVGLMPTRPEDLKLRNMPKRGYLMCEGLVILDLNNRPIKDFPGAPLTISNHAPAWDLEGLRRIFGMSYSDLRARMDPESLQTNSNFSNKPLLWIERVNKRQASPIMFVWDPKKKKAEKNTKKIASAPEIPQHELPQPANTVAAEGIYSAESPLNSQQNIYPPPESAQSTGTVDPEDVYSEGFSFNTQQNIYLPPTIAQSANTVVPEGTYSGQVPFNIQQNI